MIPTAWREEEEVERGKREEEKKREKGEKKRKRRNAITIPAHWIASFLYKPSLSTSIVLQVES